MQAPDLNSEQVLASQRSRQSNVKLESYAHDVPSRSSSVVTPPPTCSRSRSVSRPQEATRISTSSSSSSSGSGSMIDNPLAYLESITTSSFSFSGTSSSSSLSSSSHAPEVLQVSSSGEEEEEKEEEEGSDSDFQAGSGSGSEQRKEVKERERKRRKLSVRAKKAAETRRKNREQVKADEIAAAVAAALAAVPPPIPAPLREVPAPLKECSICQEKIVCPVTFCGEHWTCSTCVVEQYKVGMRVKHYIQEYDNLQLQHVRERISVTMGCCPLCRDSKFSRPDGVPGYDRETIVQISQQKYDCPFTCGSTQLDYKDLIKHITSEYSKHCKGLQVYCENCNQNIGRVDRINGAKSTRDKLHEAHLHQCTNYKCPVKDCGVYGSFKDIEKHYEVHRGLSREVNNLIGYGNDMYDRHVAWLISHVANNPEDQAAIRRTAELFHQASRTSSHEEDAFAASLGSVNNIVNLSS
jgi:hypothetical protein